MPNNFYPFLLQALCPDDPDEAYRRYIRLHEKLTGFFRLQGMYDPENDADDTINRAEEKLAKGHNVPEPTRFCRGIAKNIVHERRRAKQHEESAFLKFIENCQDKSTEALVDKIMSLIKPCFEQLSEDDQDLLIAYCKVPSGPAGAKQRRELADKRKSSISALRIRITRLRRDLQDCVRGRSKKR